MERAESVGEAREIQLRLRQQVIFQPPSSFEPRLAAGADVAFDRQRQLSFAAVVVIDLETLETIETATATETTHFPYVPGYLSFRELPVLISAWERLASSPDVLVIDGHGYAHPRRMGLACHAGVEFDLPTIGCAKSILCGVSEPLPEERGSTASLVDSGTGEVIGWSIRTRSRVRPLFLSVGHRVDLPTCADVILRLTPGGRYRFPETTRRADRLAGELKRRT